MRPADEPFLLNTGRIRDQWHTMTRTGKAAKLLTPHCRTFHRSPSRRCDTYGNTARRAGAGAQLSRRNAGPGWCPRRNSAPAPCSPPSTGTARTRPRLASARWCTPSPTRFPANRNSSTPRWRWNLMPPAGTASCWRGKRWTAQPPNTGPGCAARPAGVTNWPAPKPTAAGRDS
jgi:hypothetical protein